MSMSKANKAALLSAFVFPGAGLFVVKQKVLGSFVVAIALMNLTVIGSVVMANIEYRFDRLLSSLNSMSGNPSLNLAASLPPDDARAVQVASLFFIMTWLFSIFESYRKGRLIDRLAEILRIKIAEAHGQPNER